MNVSASGDESSVLAEAEGLKAQGNDAFGKGDIESAVRSYTAACDLLESGSNPSTRTLEITLLSNRAMGNLKLYEIRRQSTMATTEKKPREGSKPDLSLLRRCVEDCTVALSRFEVEGDKPRSADRRLRGKLLYRRAKALSAISSQSSDGHHNLKLAGEDLFELLLTGPQTKDARDLLDEVRERYWNCGGRAESGEGTRERDDAGPPLSSICRPSLYGSEVIPYYCYGHDNMGSMLAKGEPYDNIPRDGGHLPSCPALELARLPLDRITVGVLFGGVGDGRHVLATLCDVHKQYKELSATKKLLFDVHFALNDINPTIIAKNVLFLYALFMTGATDGDTQFDCHVMLYYLYFGHVMPPEVYNDLMLLIDTLLLKCGVRNLPFFRAEETVWSEVERVLRFWRAAKAGEGVFPTVRTAMSDLDEFHSTPMCPGEPAPERGMMQHWGLGDYHGCFLEVLFFIYTGALIPPERSSRTDELCRQIWQDHTDKPRLKAMLYRAREEVRENWNLNPTFYDPVYHDFHSGKIVRMFQGFDPIVDIFSSFWLTIDRKSKPYLHRDKDLKKCTAFESVQMLFGQAADAFHELLPSGAIKIELDIGPITQFCRKIQDQGESRQLPSKFHRISLSNVLDYCGMMSVFTEIAPVLHPVSDGAPSFLQANIQLNNRIWSDYGHYIYSATTIPSLDDVDTLLGLRHATYNSVWGFNQWSWSSEGPRASREQLTRWLHRLFVVSVVPPIREDMGASPQYEQCPMNAATFMRVCVFCVDVLGYPRPWLGAILDEIATACINGRFKTHATAPNGSPMTHSICKGAANTIGVAAFGLDVLTQIRHWKQRYDFSLPTFFPRKEDIICQYRIVFDQKVMEIAGEHNFINIYGDEGKSFGNGGRSSKNCLGFILSRSKDADGLDVPERAVSQHPHDGKIRREALASKSACVIFSCLEFHCDINIRNTPSCLSWVRATSRNILATTSFRSAQTHGIKSGAVLSKNASPMLFRSKM